MPPPFVSVPRLRRFDGASEAGERPIPEETPVAIVHDAATTAVMMATPADLEDFAVGFSLTEGIIANPDELTSIETVASGAGIEVRAWLRSDRSATLAARRRTLAGPTGCGLCGIDSLSEAARAPRRVGETVRLESAQILTALDELASAQVLGIQTHAVHAAGWWSLTDGLMAVREDVGRHNALDKLVGTLARGGIAPASGILVLTSRVSVEMVQKAAAFGAEVVIAVSAPTALAVRTAQASGMTLVAIARQDGFEVFTRPDRIAL